MPSYQTASVFAYAYAPEASQTKSRSNPTRDTVAYHGHYAPGTAVISTASAASTGSFPGGRVLKYGIGVGREGFEWAGTQIIS